MNGLGEWIKLLTAVTAVLGAIAAVIRVLVKRFPPRAASLADDVNRLKDEVVALRADSRKLTDYVHDLREHIAEGKPPPPPDWPEGLRV